MPEQHLFRVTKKASAANGMQIKHNGVEELLSCGRNVSDRDELALLAVKSYDTSS